LRWNRVFLEYFGMLLSIVPYTYFFHLNLKPHKLSTERMVKLITLTSNKSFFLVLTGTSKEMCLKLNQ